MQIDQYYSDILPKTNNYKKKSKLYIPFIPIPPKPIQNSNPKLSIWIFDKGQPINKNSKS